MRPGYDEIRKHIARRYRRTILLGLHFTGFMLAVLAVAWWIFTHWVYPGDWKNMGLLAVWALVLLMHWGYHRLANARDRDIEAVWMRYAQGRIEIDGQWKTGTSMLVTNGDERLDWKDERVSANQKPKRGA